MPFSSRLANTEFEFFRKPSGATTSLARLKGLQIGAGWQRAVRERLVGALGCTHLSELLTPLTTAAFQTLAPVRLARPDALDVAGRPLKIGSCHV